jgi:tetratricopeptide (TPR) repeat protein
MIGAGVQVLLNLAAKRRLVIPMLVPQALAVALPVAAGIPQVREADRHDDRSLRDLTVEVARRTTPGSLIVSDDTSLFFAFLYLQTAEGRFTDREIVAQYLLPLPWYAARWSGVDPGLQAEVESRAAARKGLHGRSLGDRTAHDSMELAVGLARRARTTRDVFIYTHLFERELTTFGDLPVASRGLVYQVIDPQREPSASIPDAVFERGAAYESHRRHTRTQQMVARRFAAAANRSAIARVVRGDVAGAEADVRQAIALEPRYAQAWFNLGIIAADYLQRPKEAEHAWRTFLSLNPAAPEAAAVKLRLAQMAAGGAPGGGPGGAPEGAPGGAPPDYPAPLDRAAPRMNAAPLDSARSGP